ncbi:DUF427 domain-containing protein [Myceligenerans xiligouense]|uniref:Uncharacterized protein (DUF427 family) n=1 Tax=Myceligenerans xiligouense TaxID=253184 RepID=A0A3N4ZGG2_9MICO|nr:DUF427 domain-containing protein [Myceligenerans xiligouense]RPF19925.1 uncharacterized protein (DUF427 family) [Myceligenerans xiligouense]
MPEIVENPFVIAPGTVQRGRTRIRAFSEGELVADATAPLLVWEHSYYPQYFFAPEDLEVEVRPTASRSPRSKALGPSELFDVVVGDRTLPGAARRYPQAPVEAMRDAFVLTWSAFDTWLEEDEVLHTHARSPYVRTDALPSSRHVRVVVGGEVVAESHRPVVLTETGLVPRYYLPRVDVRMDLLTPTDTTSHCPYKGEASYWSLSAGGTELTDIVWGYTTPLPESVRLAGLVCFWPEKSAELEFYVDGVRVGRP